MLAQNFKSAADLGITEQQLAALQKTLVLLETDKIKHAPVVFGHLSRVADRKFSGYFNMAFYHSDEDCGTVCCIAGTAELIGDVNFSDDLSNKQLKQLFHPDCYEAWAATPSQAATALRSYLTTGDAHWDLAVAS